MMPKFRHISATMGINHGSAAAEYVVKRIGGEKWVCIRPQRLISVFEFDSKKEGFERVPVVLLGKTRAEARLDPEGRVWYKNFPEPHEIFHKTLEDPDWFFAKVLEREQAFLNVKEFLRHLSQIVKTPDVQKYVLELPRWKEANSVMFPYMFLVLMTDELIIDGFRQFLASFLPRGLLGEYLCSLLRSKYVEEVVQMRKSPRLSKSLVFPSEDPFYIEAGIEFSVYSPLEAKVLRKVFSYPLNSRANFANMFFRYRLVTPIVHQLSEENLYLWKSMATHVNKILEYLADFLITRRKISKRSEILQYTIDEIIKMYEC